MFCVDFYLMLSHDILSAGKKKNINLIYCQIKKKIFEIERFFSLFLLIIFCIRCEIF